jgi:hypothetical protein
MRTLFAVAAVAALAQPAAAQLAQACIAPGAAAGGEAVKRQPRIVVIPFTKEGEDIRTVLEADILRRIALIKVQEAFDRRGFSAGDFLAMIKAPTMLPTLGQTDLRAQLFEQARAEIYVELEVTIEESGSARRALVLARSYLTANGLSLGNQILSSPLNAGTPSALVENATSANKVEPLLAYMQEKFDEYNDNGVPIAVDIAMAQGAQTGPNSAVGGAAGTLGGALEEWLGEHAWRGIYNVSLLTDTRMILDEVRIPLLDPKTCRNYSALRFGRELVNHLATLDVRAAPSLTVGTLFIELR